MDTDGTYAVGLGERNQTYDIDGGQQPVDECAEVARRNNEVGLGITKDVGEASVRSLTDFFHLVPS
jgi:hypothetical protein